MRFAAALHRLVPEGRAPSLAGRHPTAGGRPDLGTLRDDALPVLHEHADELRTLIATAVVQTDEPGRSAPLFGGLRPATHLAAGVVHRRAASPISLLEVGASGGLNLRPHRLAHRFDGGRVGDPGSPMTLDPRWTGRPLADLRHAPRPVRRAGCDPDPVDVSTEDGRRRLSSFVRADRAARPERLRAAVDLARPDPVPVQRATDPQWPADRPARNATS